MPPKKKSKGCWQLEELKKAESGACGVGWLVRRIHAAATHWIRFVTVGHTTPSNRDPPTRRFYVLDYTAVHYSISIDPHLFSRTFFVNPRGITELEHLTDKVSEKKKKFHLFTFTFTFVFSSVYEL